MRMDIALLYFDDCPNWKVVDERLSAIAAERADRTVTRHLVETLEDAERVGFHGSPSILVDGVDVFADPEAGVGLSCRVYRTPDGLAVDDDRGTAGTCRDVGELEGDEATTDEQDPRREHLQVQEVGAPRRSGAVRRIVGAPLESGGHVSRTLSGVTLAIVHVRAGEPDGLRLAHGAVTGASKLSSVRVPPATRTAGRHAGGPAPVPTPDSWPGWPGRWPRPGSEPPKVAVVGRPPKPPPTLRVHDDAEPAEARRDGVVDRHGRRAKTAFARTRPALPPSSCASGCPANIGHRPGLAPHSDPHPADQVTAKWLHVALAGLPELPDGSM